MLKVTSQALDPQMDFGVSGHRLAVFQAVEVDGRWFHKVFFLHKIIKGGRVQDQELVQNIQSPGNDLTLSDCDTVCR